jgi:hypothetical protein
MSVRDRYDVGDKKQQADTQRAEYVRGMVQQSTALRTIEIANAAVRAGTAGPFALALVQAWAEQRRVEGW